MSNLIQKTTDLAMHIVSAYVREDSFVIDATCGGGFDTVRLAGMHPRRLVAFDLQKEAAKATRSRLAEAGFAEELADGRFTVACLGHERMREFLQREFDQERSATDCSATTDATVAGSEADATVAVSETAALGGIGSADAIVFNLGYLPGGDKSITTTAETTIAAVKQALELLSPDGVICLTMYSGHGQGKKEKTALLAFAEGLDSHLYHTAYIRMTNQKKDPPEILLITKKAR